MSSTETFARLCERVCEEQGWSLGPAGVELSLPDGRHQVIGMEFFEFQDQKLVRLYTTIGRADVLGVQRLSLALQVNGRLAHGALAVRDEQLIMAETLLLEGADAAEIRAAIHYLAETADYYEKIFFGTDDH